MAENPQGLPSWHVRAGGGGGGRRGQQPGQTLGKSFQLPCWAPTPTGRIRARSGPGACGDLHREQRVVRARERLLAMWTGWHIGERHGLLSLSEGRVGREEGTGQHERRQAGRLHGGERGRESQTQRARQSDRERERQSMRQETEGESRTDGHGQKRRLRAPM